MTKQRWRWALLGLAVVVAVAIPLILIPRGGDDDSEPEAVVTDEAPVLIAPRENQPGVKITEQGAVELTGVRSSRPGPDSLVVGYATDAPVRAAIQVFDTTGRPLASAKADGDVGENVEVVPLSRPVTDLVRYVIALVPTDGADPTTASVSVPPLTSSVQVVTPTPGSTVEGGVVSVVLRTRNFDISDQGGALAQRQGHVHLTLDDRTYVVVYGTRFTFREVPAGEHLLIVTPARNDHTPVPGLDAIEVAFTTTG